MSKVTLNIPFGYELKEEVSRHSVEEAREILVTRKRKKYTIARRDDNNVFLTRHYIQCPHCNYKIYAYPQNIKKAFNIIVPSRTTVVEKDTIFEWTSQQISILKKDYEPLELSQVVDINISFNCPKCNKNMVPSAKKAEATLSRSRHKISVSFKTMDFMEAFKWKSFRKDYELSLPLEEKIVFNFKKRKVHIGLFNAMGECLAASDITSVKESWNSCLGYNIIVKNKYLKRHLIKLFEEEIGHKIPFFYSELSLSHLKMLTVFPSYDRDFYSYIPFEENTLSVIGSFKSAARKMRTEEDLIRMYESSNLPKVKSIKKIFFENIALFFYIEECEKLWSIVQNIDNFVRIFKNGDIFGIVSDCHVYPQIFVFLEEYIACGKIRQLFNKNGWSHLCEYAVMYVSLSEYLKSKEREKWKKNILKPKPAGGPPTFSVPMQKPNEKIKSCMIDGFLFTWLRSSNEYKHAGKVLQNCLISWQRQFPPVVGIYKDDLIIGAIEIEGNYVIQAHLRNNGSMSANPVVYKAYLKWLESNSLTERAEDEYPFNRGFFDPDDDMPF